MKNRLAQRLINALEPASKPYEVIDTETPGLLLRVQPSGAKAFYVTYRTQGGRNGKRKRIRLGTPDVLTVEQARRLAKETLARVLQGEDPAKDRQVPEVTTLGDLIDTRYAQWAELHLRGGKTQTERIRQCFSEWWDKPLQDINAWLLRKYQSQRLKGSDDKPAVKPSTIQRDIAALRGAIRFALDEGILTENPLDGLKPLKSNSTPIVRYLSDDERKCLYGTLQARDERLKCARASGNRWREARGYKPRQDLTECRYGDHITPLVLTALNTGLRRLELFRLRWTDIDLDQRTLTVRAETAKAGKVRRIPLNDTLLDVLTEWRRQCDPGNDLVFPSPKGGGQLTRLTETWKAILKEAGITGFRFHDCRHDFASRMAMRGVSLRAIQQLLGHSTIALTERYSHLAPSAMTEAVSTLDTKPTNVVNFTDAQSGGE